MTINYGEVIFDGPTPATEWEPPYRAAVYAIMTPDETYKPKPFRIIYFGESGNLSERGFWKSHHKYRCFLANAGSDSNIYIGIHLMPDSTEEERKKVEQKLTNEYHPICND